MSCTNFPHEVYWPLAHIWPSKAELARDLDRPYPTVGAWFSPGRQIPPAKFPEIIRAAQARGHELTWQDLEAANRRGGAAA